MSVNDPEERRPKADTDDVNFPGFAGPQTPDANQSFAKPVYDTPHEQRRPADDTMVARSADAVSWTAFNTVVSALLSLGIAAVGGGFACLHSDLSDIRTDIRDIRTDIRDSRADTRDMRADVRDMRTGFASIQADMQDTHTRIQGMQTDIRDIRGSVNAIDGGARETREDMIKAISGLEKQSALTNSKLDELAGSSRKVH
jgi:septal ring factor EnvC (AmiA/AmiB activator)